MELNRSFPFGHVDRFFKLLILELVCFPLRFGRVACWSVRTIYKACCEIYFRISNTRL
ncbi:hypothetical protein D3C73_1555860 [compost metagenome]